MDRGVSAVVPRTLLAGMSEYQYYEFRAIDRPLTDRQVQELRAISTRAAISRTSFSNDYTYGDLKANPRDRAGWERLLRARMVLGQSQQAAADYREARQAFSGSPADQQALRDAAARLGLPVG